MRKFVICPTCRGRFPPGLAGVIPPHGTRTTACPGATPPPAQPPVGPWFDLDVPAAPYPARTSSRVRFYLTTPWTDAIDARHALNAIKPTRRGPARRVPSPSLERCGAWTLDAAREPAPKRPWCVRIPYESMGGEQLAADFGGLTEPAATALAARYRGRAWPATEEAPSSPTRRIVIFPSEAAP